MAGKRYSTKEIERIVELGKEGKTFTEIQTTINDEFKVERHIPSLKIIFNRHKNQEQAVAK